MNKIFDYKQPDYHQVQDMEKLNKALYVLLDEISFVVPQCREKELAITKLEECAMWAKKGITLG